MKSKLVRIGNSRGVRLPKPVIEAAGLTEEVELEVKDGAVMIARSQKPRAGWAEAAKQLRAHGQDRLLDPLTATRFDDEDWKW